MMSNLYNAYNKKNNIEKITLLQRNFKKIINYRNNIRSQLNHFLNICNDIVNQLNNNYNLKILTHSELHIGLVSVFEIIKEIELLNKYIILSIGKIIFAPCNL